MNCWNCEGPLTPTHQCEEVADFSQFDYSQYSLGGKYRDERGVFYNSSSDACDVAQRCPECAECTVERHAALFREKK